MDQSEAPILDGLVDYRKSNRYGFTPPGHRQGRGTDDRVLDVLGHEPFRDDILASGGLDDRRTSNKYLKRAEDLMAEAVGAEMAFFSTCGSSLSVKAAMMAVAGWLSRLGPDAEAQPARARLPAQPARARLPAQPAEACWSPETATSRSWLD